MRFSTVLASPTLNLARGKGNGQNGQNGQNAQNGQNQGNNNANNGQNNAGNNAGNNAANGANCLDPTVISTNANNDGLADAEAGQAASATDANNFINFCKGKTITNGLQVKGGSCNPIPMGNIPSTNNMISAVMVNPKNGDNVDANQAINFQVQIANLVAGTFTNPDVTYYVAPQDLQGGNVVGHTHISVQDLGNDINSDTPPNAQDFVFFKGINDAGNNNGLLAANLAAGLPNGNYRVCSMTSAANHQPVLMPVAQRGPQDDCEVLVTAVTMEATKVKMDRTLSRVKMLSKVKVKTLSKVKVKLLSRVKVKPLNKVKAKPPSKVKVKLPSKVKVKPPSKVKAKAKAALVGAERERVEGSVARSSLFASSLRR
ncbi:hypothetical protein N0V90_002474 [Kalmusia sp. IMI 367209]|nr:hypothetical protein N0V90_002474 [Kalmusia sp. IMI 367209]